MKTYFNNSTSLSYLNNTILDDLNDDEFDYLDEDTAYYGHKEKMKKKRPKKSDWDY